MEHQSRPNSYGGGRSYPHRGEPCVAQIRRVTQALMNRNQTTLIGSILLPWPSSTSTPKGHGSLPLTLHFSRTIVFTRRRHSQIPLSHGVSGNEQSGGRHGPRKMDCDIARTFLRTCRISWPAAFRVSASESQSSNNTSLFSLPVHHQSIYSAQQTRPRRGISSISAWSACALGAFIYVPFTSFSTTSFHSVQLPRQLPSTRST